MLTPHLLQCLLCTTLFWNDIHDNAHCPSISNCIISVTGSVSFFGRHDKVVKYSPWQSYFQTFVQVVVMRIYLPGVHEFKDPCRGQFSTKLAEKIL
jgi:hypothetical protein